MSGSLYEVGHLYTLGVCGWGYSKNMATPETEVSLQRKRETLQSHKTLEMGCLDRFLNPSHFLEETIQEQHRHLSFRAIIHEVQRGDRGGV